MIPQHPNLFFLLTWYRCEFKTKSIVCVTAQMIAIPSHSNLGQWYGSSNDLHNNAITFIYLAVVIGDAPQGTGASSELFVLLNWLDKMRLADLQASAFGASLCFWAKPGISLLSSARLMFRLTSREQRKLGGLHRQDDVAAPFACFARVAHRNHIDRFSAKS